MTAIMPSLRAPAAEPLPGSPRIAVILPCFDEGAAIGEVVRGFRRALPMAEIHVFDNDSRDDTAATARAAGAFVHWEGRRGKGNVVRRMFADIDADIYVMADGDGTYDPEAAPEMVRRLIADRLDMIVGTRLESAETTLFRRGHRFGNRVLTGLVRFLFGRAFEDMLSGYRVFSRRFVKSFPGMSSGFEIETELSVHALQLRLPTAEHRTAYKTRMQGSASKLNTFRDGIRILLTILQLLRDARPALFFSCAALGFGASALALAAPILVTYYETGLVPRLPTAVLAVGLVMLGALSFACGLILDSVSNGRIEHKRLVYLNAGK